LRAVATDPRKTWRSGRRTLRIARTVLVGLLTLTALAVNAAWCATVDADERQPVAGAAPRLTHRAAATPNAGARRADAPPTAPEAIARRTASAQLMGRSVSAWRKTKREISAEEEEEDAARAGRAPPGDSSKARRAASRRRCPLGAGDM